MMRMSFSSSTKLSIRHAENQNITNLQAINCLGTKFLL